MKKIILGIGLIILMAAISSADILRGTIPQPGQYSLFLDRGSQTVATNIDFNIPKKYQVNSYTELGFTYGITDRLALGLSLQPLTVEFYPGVKTTKLKWWYEGFLPANFILDYYLGQVQGVELKGRFKYALAKRKLIYDKTIFPKVPTLLDVTEEQSLTIHDSSLGIWGSKQLDNNLTIGLGLEYVVNVYKASDDLEKLVIDLDRKFFRVLAGIDYAFNPDFSCYIYGGHAFNSNAVGSHDPEVNNFLASDLLKRDDYGLFSGGFRLNF